MNDLPRKKLAELVGRFGCDIAIDSRRCEGLLRDVCPQHRREISVLVIAIKESVPSELLSSSQGVPKQVLLSRLSKRLHENCGIDENFARWAVESWALALGVADSKDFPPSLSSSPDEKTVLISQSISSTTEPSDATAQFNLGLSYHTGTGVSQNSEEAQKWLNLAAQNGNQNAVDYLKSKTNSGAAKNNKDVIQGFGCIGVLIGIICGIIVGFSGGGFIGFLHIASGGYGVGLLIGYLVNRFSGRGKNTKTASMPQAVPKPKSRVVAALLAVFFGGIGAHKYYLGSWGWGIVLCVLFVLTNGTSGLVMGLFALFEAFVYLRMTQEAFAEKYSPEKRAAFRWW